MIHILVPWARHLILLVPRIFSAPAKFLEADFKISFLWNITIPEHDLIHENLISESETLLS